MIHPRIIVIRSQWWYGETELSHCGPGCISLPKVPEAIPSEDHWSFWVDSSLVSFDGVISFITIFFMGNHHHISWLYHVINVLL